ncbi:MAG: phosphoribosylanthranilate isomerase [Chthoniobacter sp.]|uniref:phosphoribosylanthranilate isomerase n=1 Tax=Chthoniobacter sp. TaxID=2510640 RepID=UPI0032A18BBC
MNTARVRVKICGITNEEDARAATDLGADALGFNLWPGSKRHIDLDRAFSWIRGLPPLVTRVAVLVNVSLDEARHVAAHPAIDLVQFHGDEDEGYCAQFAASGRPFIKALRIRDSASLDNLDRFSTPSILLDADAGAAYGGTGRQLDPALAAEAAQRFPGVKIVLAGGLKPENVAEAIRVAQPYAVDVASGVEAAPGRKDHEKMARFIAAVRGA